MSVAPPAAVAHQHLMKPADSESLPPKRARRSFGGRRGACAASTSNPTLGKCRSKHGRTRQRGEAAGSQFGGRGRFSCMPGQRGAFGVHGLPGGGGSRSLRAGNRGARCTNRAAAGGRARCLRGGRRVGNRHEHLCSICTSSQPGVTTLPPISSPLGGMNRHGTACVRGCMGNQRRGRHAAVRRRGPGLRTRRSTCQGLGAI